MNLRQRLIVSVSTLALMSSGAYAIELGPDAARTQHLLTQEETAQLPAQTDKNLPRVFTVFLKPGAAGSEQLVQNYFRSFGFRTEYFPYTNSVKLQGSFAQAEMAGHFTYVAGRLPITPLRTSIEPTFPPPVKNAILVTTFNPGPVMKPFFSVTVNTPTTMPQHLGVYGLAPSDYGAIYGYNQLYGAGYNGSGQIVDIAACHGYSTSDLTTFHTDFGLSPAPNVTAVTANNPVASSIEPDLDVQRVYGTAPGATIRMWFSATCAIGDFANLFTDIANDQATHPAAALTVSYGLSELLMTHYYGSAPFVAADTALSKITGGAAQNVALFVASGDDGDFSVFDAENLGTPLGQADVAFFASDPNVLAVGGTTLVLTNSFTRAQEFAWSGSATGNSGGSGGGVSNIWPIPAWQVGVAGTASQTFKNVPDVSAVASLSSPPLMVSGGAVIQVGGTSAASPTWGGTIALIQQYWKTKFGTTLTHWPQALYGHTNYFTDVTQGSNGRFTAGPGYDNVTGLGVVCLLHFATGQPCVNGEIAEE